MRIRQVKPEFFSDKVLAGLDADTKLFYIGLWMQADDDGYIKWEPERIAAELYPYRGMAARERFVLAASARLVETGHLVALECGRHATVPGLPRHQVIAATRRVLRIHGEHNAQCTGNGHPVRSMEIQSGTVGNGRVGNGNARKREETTEQSSIDGLLSLLADPNSTEPAKKAARKALERAGYKTDG